MDHFKQRIQKIQKAKIKETPLVLLCTTPRTGSSLLSDIMKTQQICSFEEFCTDIRITQSETIRNCALILINKQKNIFKGCKLFFHEFSCIVPVWNTLEEFFHTENILYIKLSRRDLDKQAVSWSIAQRTGRWSYKQGQPEPKILYNFNEIKFAKDNIIKAELHWRSYLQGRSYLSLIYEEFIQNIPKTIRDIQQFLNINIPLKSYIGKLRESQHYSFSDDFYERFKQDSSH